MRSQSLFVKEDVKVVVAAVVGKKPLRLARGLRLALREVPLQARSWHLVLLIVRTSHFVVVKASHLFCSSKLKLLSPIN